MQRLLLATIPLPQLLAFELSPQLSNLIVSVIIALVVYFTGRAPSKRGKHRDDYDAN